MDPPGTGIRYPEVIPQWGMCQEVERTRVWGSRGANIRDGGRFADIRHWLQYGAAARPLDG
ncbi:hypothetical protein GCM10009526_32130 [Glutamicibacter creatinolyticus]